MKKKLSFTLLLSAGLFLIGCNEEKKASEASNTSPAIHTASSGKGEKGENSSETGGKSERSQKLAVVNMNEIRDGSKVFQDFQKTVETEYKSFQSKVTEREGGLRERFEKIKAKEEKLQKTDESLEKDKEAFQKDLAVMEQDVQKEKATLDDRFKVIAADVEKAIKSVIEDIAKKHGYDLVLNTMFMEAPIVMHHHEGIDITKEVIEELDKKMPEVQKSMVKETEGKSEK
jgi:Skp family chaperone for outer membrane proteins